MVSVTGGSDPCPLQTIPWHLPQRKITENRSQCSKTVREYELYRTRYHFVKGGKHRLAATIFDRWELEKIQHNALWNNVPENQDGSKIHNECK
jgi:hypothetical protein